MPALPRQVNYVVAAYNNDLFGAANTIASALRASGNSVNLLLEKYKVKKAFNFADRAGADRCAFVAPDEWATGKVRVKDLRHTSDESKMGVDVPIDDLANIDSYFHNAPNPVSSDTPATSNKKVWAGRNLKKSACGRFSRPQ